MWLLTWTCRCLPGCLRGTRTWKYLGRYYTITEVNRWLHITVERLPQGIHIHKTSSQTKKKSVTKGFPHKNASSMCNSLARGLLWDEKVRSGHIERMRVTSKTIRTKNKSYGMYKTNRSIERPEHYQKV